MSALRPEYSGQSMISPYEKYIQYHSEHNLGSRDSIYLSHAVTSGGFYRMKDSLTRDEYITKNCNLVTEFVRILKITDHIADHVFPILPAEIFVPGWHDFEYMTFFDMCILGINPNYASDLAYYMNKQFSDQQRVIMNNKALDPELRLPIFFEHAKKIREYVISRQIPHRPVLSVLKLLDNDISIGSQAEEYLGLIIPVPVHEFRIVDIKHPHLEKVRDAVLELSCAGMPIISQQMPDHIHPVSLILVTKHAS